MKNLLISAVFAALVAIGPPSTAAAKTVAGVKFPATVQPAADNVKLIGAGLRTKWMVKVYAMAAYSGSGKRSASAIINANEPKFIWIRMLRTISGDKMKAAIDEGIEDNVDGATRAKISGQVSKLKRAFSGSIPKGADIGFIYTPGKGTIVRFRSVDKVTLKGTAMMKALWSIWFGKEPADDDLKDAIVGR